ncbi:MAG: ABC transporter ATP-binding protein [Bacteroidetes bacterium]|nr:MAG: ABC transporter ATP-binding protein [Bacteroidota bacterium]
MSIVIDQIDLSFDTVQALSKVDFEVQDGELFGLIGPDGAGKSTLFRIMASLLVPDAGRCQVHGHDVVKDYREVRKIIGYMPGRFSLYMDLSVEENLAFYARVFGTTVKENYDLIRDVYEQIAPFKKRLAGKLSGGMKQKLALSCALIHRPEVLILDEPTTGVDAVSRGEFWEMLKKIQAQGITIVVSTPYMDEAELCDRVALLQKGRVLEITDPSLATKGDGVELFSLRSSRGAYAYLERIRSMEECKYAWLFGDELHVSPKSPADAERMNMLMEQWDDPTLKWQVIVPSIEDRFMWLIEQNSEEQFTNGETI